MENIMEPRPLREIAWEIRETWPNVWFGAKPYLEAMCFLDKVTDRWGYDDAESIVRYFLVNAKTWRGEDAKRIKAELRSML